MTLATEKLTQCRSPRCKEPPVVGRRFCVYHVGVLDRVKDSEKKRADKVRSTIKRKGAQPTCCVPGCHEPRLSAERYCPACQANGWDEADYDR